MVSAGVTPSLFPRARYWGDIADFLTTSDLAILGALNAHSDQDETTEQRAAWAVQIGLLRAALAGLQGAVALEFNIPRMGHRADAVLLLGATIVVIEFKIEAAARFSRAALVQAWDYAFELKYFHRASHGPRILPVLVVPEAPDPPEAEWVLGAGGVYEPVACNRRGLRRLLEAAMALAGRPIAPAEWYRSPYLPCPTIIEAARRLYQRHTVAEIATAEAGKAEREAATACLRRLAREARDRRLKIICFLTGVPGAGKTLVGLDLATDDDERDQPHAVFLSGNGPLVAVLRAALVRDERERRKAAPVATEEPEAKHSVKEFIQNVHMFRKEAMSHADMKPEHVVVFDEAQRAWTRAKLRGWLARRSKVSGFEASEPEYLIEVMARPRDDGDWAMIVCLVGEGQEINDGEAGIGEWFQALARRFPDWRVYGPREVAAIGEAQAAWRELQTRAEVYVEPALHLKTCVRSRRAENLSSFVNALIECEQERARAEWRSLRGRYPLVLTRHLDRAKEWVRAQAAPGERYGMLATSKAVRLKPLAIDVRMDVDPVPWFLNGPDDLRSSFALEDAATEFDVQGLELDWACVVWDGDMRRDGEGWSFHNVRHFRGRGSRWTHIKNVWAQTYARNAYRVLLTRARRGIAICIPEGDAGDCTRLPEFYQATYNYLLGLGLEPI